MRCWNNAYLSRQAKLGWLGIIIFAWPFGSFFYEVVVEKQPIIRFSTIFVAFSLTFCGTILFIRLDVREKAWALLQNPNFFPILQQQMNQTSQSPFVTEEKL